MPAEPVRWPEDRGPMVQGTMLAAGVSKSTLKPQFVGTLPRPDGPAVLLRQASP
jgi:hypothetical protein